MINGVKNRGQAIYEGVNVYSQSGYWTSILIDRRRGLCRAVPSRKLNSFVEGY